jgi:hypothetical protein
MKKIIVLDVAMLLPTSVKGTGFMKLVADSCIFSIDAINANDQIKNESLWFSYQGLCQCTKYEDSLNFSINFIKKFGGFVDNSDAIKQYSNLMKEYMLRELQVIRPHAKECISRAKECGVEIILFGNCSLREADLLFKIIPKESFTYVYLSCYTGKNMYKPEIKELIESNVDDVSALKLISPNCTGSWESFNDSYKGPLKCSLEDLWRYVNDVITQLNLIECTMP